MTPKKTKLAVDSNIRGAPNKAGRGSKASAVYLGIHGCDDPALDVGATFATEDEVWDAAIRRVHSLLSDIKKTSGKTLEYVRGWIEGVARERGVDLIETKPVPVQIEMFRAAAA
ncbi:hypothetical protein [Aureimonas psammosilenae]|uniref:hypothetical protein n=1 Tax=Aureimonas psammosilenae TaxID=2495496 RepID=UPI001261074F|nr:hypothetical protein [Aureimonas psammosilenae]